MIDNEKKNEAAYTGYEYREITVPRDLSSLCMDSYPCFGWELEPNKDKETENRHHVSGIRTPEKKETETLYFRRNRNLCNKAELTRLQRNFDRFIEEIDVLELYELREKDLSVYRILFTSCSTEELDFLPDSLAVVQTELFFDEQEKQRIRGILVNGSRARDFRMRDYLHPESIYTGLEAGSEQECIDGICRILQPMLKSPEALRNDLIQCETMMPSRPRDNVIFLSGLRAHTQRAFVAVFVLKRPVHWNQSLHKAQIIVYWDRGKAAQDAESFENEYIPHLLEKVFQDRNIIDEMVKNPDYEHLMEVMMEIHSAVLTMGSSFR